MAFEEYGTGRAYKGDNYAGYPLYSEDPRVGVAELLGRIAPTPDDEIEYDLDVAPLRPTRRGDPGWDCDSRHQLDFELRD